MVRINVCNNANGVPNQEQVWYGMIVWKKSPNSYRLYQSRINIWRYIFCNTLMFEACFTYLDFWSLLNLYTGVIQNLSNATYGCHQSCQNLKVLVDLLSFLHLFESPVHCWVTLKWPPLSPALSAPCCPLLSSPACPPPIPLLGN